MGGPVGWLQRGSRAAAADAADADAADAAAADAAVFCG